MTVENRTPDEAWDALRAGGAELVDVRTRAEWTFVGLPDLTEAGARVHCVEWKRWPDMAVDPRFVDHVLESLGGRTPETLLFICRSGVRSMEAAMTVEAALAADGRDVACVNVAEGFEGDLDAHGRRGAVNG